MNRHERRRLAKVSEVKRISIKELADMGFMCAWEGCGAHFEGDAPPGWVWMVPSRTWRSSSPGRGCVTACYARNMRASLMPC
jgi:hypothetical protein